MLSAVVRERRVISSRQDNLIVVDGKKCINFCSNDYLGLATNQSIKASFISGLEKYGFGSSASALVSGYFKPHQQLEEDFAEFLNRDRAVYFNSGYQANIGTIQSLAKRQDSIISDRLCHASIIDGIILSRAKHKRYQHNSIIHLQQILQSTPGRKIVVTERIFSMEGDTSPLESIAKECDKHQTLLIVDDAHGVGVLDQLTQQEIHCLVVPLGKAFCAVGGIAAGSSEIIEAITQQARTYIYTTALPPAIASATIQTLKIIKQETWRREKLNALTSYFTIQAKLRNLPLVSYDLTPIRSVLVHENQIALKLQQKLLEKGFYTACIRPPTVPQNFARVRITLNCNHTEQEISQLLDYIYECLQNKNS